MTNETNFTKSSDSKKGLCVTLKWLDNYGMKVGEEEFFIENEDQMNFQINLELNLLDTPLPDNDTWVKNLYECYPDVIKHQYDCSKYQYEIKIQNKG